MELYEAIEKRRTVRDFLDKTVPDDVFRRILAAGLKAPTHDHARNWHFVVLRDPARIADVLKAVAGKTAEQVEIVRKWKEATESQRAMYGDALPKQTRMLMQSRCLVIPLFKAGEELMHPQGVTTLNPFASIWCVIENILLAATAEGLGVALRIPLGTDEEEAYVLNRLGVPPGYKMPCYLAFGYPAPNAPVLKQTACPLEERLHAERW